MLEVGSGEELSLEVGCQRHSGSGALERREVVVLEGPGAPPRAATPWDGPVTGDEVLHALGRFTCLFQRAYLFGFVARGTPDAYSDIDLALILYTSLPFFDRIREVLDLVFCLGKADVLIYTPDEFQEML